MTLSHIHYIIIFFYISDSDFKLSLNYSLNVLSYAISYIKLLLKWVFLMIGAVNIDTILGSCVTLQSIKISDMFISYVLHYNTIPCIFQN